MVTTTSRRPRKGEVKGKDYHFITRKQFEKRIKQNKFLEYVEYNDHYYGTPKTGAGKNKVLIVEPKGANSIYEKNLPNTIIILLQTSEEKRKHRMLERGDNLIQVLDRLEKDDKLFDPKNLKHIDFIVNTNEGTPEELALKIHDLYHYVIDQENQISIFDLLR